jgi:hypothetical protein
MAIVGRANAALATFAVNTGTSGNLRGLIDTMDSICSPDQDGDYTKQSPSTSTTITIHRHRIRQQDRRSPPSP